MSYGNKTEDLFHDAPEPLTHYFDANLMHNMLHVKAINGVIPF